MIATVLHFLEDFVQTTARFGIVFMELIGIIIMLITGVKAIIAYFRKEEDLVLNLAQGTALALEFKLGGEVLRTVIVREWTELAIIGAVIVLRGAMTLLLHWKIKTEKERIGLVLSQHESLK